MTDEVKINIEERLLLELCRIEFSEEQIKKISTLAACITDWNYFSSLANAHGTAALIWHNLEKTGLLTYIPDEVAAFLRGALMRSLSRNTFHTEIMGEILGLMNKADIRTVLLKGLALEFTVYGNAGLRQMSDVDILISRERCIDARNLLIRNSFISLPVKSILHEVIIADTGKHLPSLIKNGESIEIHHELFGERKNNLTRILYDSSYEIEIQGEKGYIPQPQIFFLYLVSHLWSHEMKNESQLRLYTDLVVMIEKYRNEIINENLLLVASNAGMSGILARYLESLRVFWGTPFPKWIDSFIEKWHDSGSISKFIFFLKSPKNNPPYGKANYYRLVVGNIPGLHRKFLFLLGDIFPGITFMKKRYGIQHTWKVLFYYPHRLGKVLWLFGKTLRHYGAKV